MCFFRSAISYARYDPTKGYQWEFPNNKTAEVGGEKKQQSQKEEPSDPQRRRVDSLLADLVRKFPPRAFSRKVHRILYIAALILTMWLTFSPFLSLLVRMEGNQLLVSIIIMKSCIPISPYDYVLCTCTPCISCVSWF